MILVHRANTSKQAVAFTFDDGPDPIYTPQLLEMFREAGGKATFFMIGSQIDANPDIARRVYAEGHEIGNHTDSHPNLTEIEPDEIVSELTRCAQKIGEITGELVRTFRPPYIGYNDNVYAIVQEHFGYPAIGAMNMQANDWSNPGVEHIVAESRDHVSAGSILIFHDGWGDRSQTVEAVRQLIQLAVERGIQLVTVSELLHMAECEA